MQNKKWYATGIVIAAFAVACGSPESDNIKGASDAVNSAAAVPAEEKSDKPVKPTTNVKVPLLLSEGTWTVGKKESFDQKVITPGLYVLSVDDGQYNCYWARIKNFDGELASIIANDNISPGAIVTVNVKKTDKGLELGNGCIGTKKKK